jgi:hypothetical protein
MTTRAERAARDTMRDTIFRQSQRQEHERQRRLKKLADLPVPPLGRALINGQQLGLRYDIPARNRGRLPRSRTLPAPVGYDPTTEEVLWRFDEILELEARLGWQLGDPSPVGYRR